MNRLIHLPIALFLLLASAGSAGAAAMVEAVQMLARTEAILLDPVYTGKIMAGLIGLAREGYFKPNEQVLFLHTGGLPSLHAYEDVVLGRVGV